MDFDDWCRDFRQPNAEVQLKYGRGAVGHYCTECGERADQYDPVGPINVVISDPELIGPEGIEREFCSWESLADWSAVQAGRRAPR
jgi:hypothetical protein